jgi:cytochrome c
MRPKQIFAWGVYMEVPGVPDETEQINLIAYLRTLSDKPMPLP